MQQARTTPPTLWQSKHHLASLMPPNPSKPRTPKTLSLLGALAVQLLKVAQQVVSLLSVEEPWRFLAGELVALPIMRQ